MVSFFLNFTSKCSFILIINKVVCPQYIAKHFDLKMPNLVLNPRKGFHVKKKFLDSHRKEVSNEQYSVKSDDVAAERMYLPKSPSTDRT